MENNLFLTEMILSELSEIVGPDFVSVKESDKFVYSTDWAWMPQMWLDRGKELRPPDYIVHPGSAEEISEILEIANKYRIPVVPWGGGSGTQGAALPIFGGILIDMKRMDKIIAIDEKSLTVTAQAGIIIAQLEWALNEKGFMLPHYAASSNCATLGGALAPRGTGTISTKYGKAEDMVLSMQIVLPTGEIIRTPPVPKHAAGPDWFRLFLGAERLGALFHTWEILCPNCRVSKMATRSAEGVPPRFHCDLCAVDYEADLARNVELRFSVHPRLRPASAQVYCLGGPANFPHIWAQLYMLPRTERVFSLELVAEAFRARSLRQNRVCPLEPDAGAPGEVVLTYREDGWYQLRQRFRPGQVSMRLQNETDAVVVLVVEQVRWDPFAITAAEAMSNPLFQTVRQVEGPEWNPIAGVHPGR